MGRTALQEAGDKAKTANKEVKDLKVKEASAKEERDALNSELQQQTKEKTKLEFALKDLGDEVAGDSNSKERAEHELEKLKVTTKEKEKELEQIKPSYDKKKKKKVGEKKPPPPKKKKKKKKKS